MSVIAARLLGYPLTPTERITLRAIECIHDAESQHAWDDSKTQALCRDFLEASPDHAAYDRRLNALLRLSIVREER